LMLMSGARCGFFASNLLGNRAYREEAAKLAFNYVGICRVHVLCV